MKKNTQKHQNEDKVVHSVKICANKFVNGATFYFFEAMIHGFDRIDLSEPRGLFRYHFIESLILAQDERWRRA